MYCQYTYNMVGVIKVKTEVLRMLKETDDYLSGQEICERLNVSRTAVWKVIKQLEAEGYEIEAVRNRGYRLRFLGRCSQPGRAGEQHRQRVGWKKYFIF